jgi:hypothetical protein
VGALCALALLAALVITSNAPAAGPPELRIAASGRPLPLPTISPPPRVDRPMHWSGAPSVRPAGTPSFAGGRAVVGLVSPSQAGAVAGNHGVRGLYLDRTLRTMEVAGTPERLRAFAATGDPRVRYVEPLRSLRYFHRRNDPWANTVDSATGLPYEWTFAHLGVDQAFNLGHGSPTILVGVIDSGVAPVPDLTGKVAQTFFLPSDATDASDSEGHGTFVSSIIAANDDDGIGLAGFCGACKLLVFKIERLDPFTVAAAIHTLVDEHVRVINMSFGGPSSASVITDAVNYAFSHGVLLVASAGNESTTDPVYPAALLQAEGGQPGNGLVVGASNATDARASFSNYGTRLSLLAPGSFSEIDCRLGILSALPPPPTEFDGDNCITPFTDPATGGRYAYAEGTSFSAPEVVGIAALAWAAAPNLKSSDLVAVLDQTATRPAGTGWTPDAGWGIVNAARTLEFVTGKSSADRVVVAGITPTAAPRSGQLFQISAKARWSDAVPLPTGTAACNVTVAGKRIAARGQLAEGILVCQWRIPKLARTARMRGTVIAGDPTGLTGSAPFSFTIKVPAKPKPKGR